MRHNQSNKDFKFVKEPEEFNKYSDKEFLQYCLGATLYMPSHKDVAKKVINKEIEGLTTMVMCFEDAIREEDLEEAENNVLYILGKFYSEEQKGNITINDLPLFFLRVRNTEQFKTFSAKIPVEHLRYLTGFIFPKFTSRNGDTYLEILKELNISSNEILYGMPILESKEIIYKENRLFELKKIQEILNEYKRFILNVRVGATDFSSLYGVRRGIDYTIYDIHVVRECLIDIVNFFNRSEDYYVISAPVWEYFSQNNRILTSTLGKKSFRINNFVKKRESIINDATDGLIREVILDKANGFIGKTIIHPSHIKFVNAIECVSREEYEDAKMIIENQGGGVMKGSNGNKMNEINPHTNWAKKILMLSKAYGVIENDTQVFLF